MPKKFPPVIRTGTGTRPSVANAAGGWKVRPSFSSLALGEA